MHLTQAFILNSSFHHLSFFSNGTMNSSRNLSFHSVFRLTHIHCELISKILETQGPGSRDTAYQDPKCT